VVCALKPGGGAGIGISWDPSRPWFIAVNVLALVFLAWPGRIERALWRVFSASDDRAETPGH
jgi:hypothetical protein